MTGNAALTGMLSVLWHGEQPIAISYRLRSFHAIDESELMIEVHTDVPVHTEEWIAAHLDADGAAAERDGPQHRHHVGAAESEREKIGIENAGGVGIVVRYPDRGCVSQDTPPWTRVR